MVNESRIKVDAFVELAVGLNEPRTCVIVKPRTRATADGASHAAGRILALDGAAVDGLLAALVDMRKELHSGAHG